MPKRCMLLLVVIWLLSVDFAVSETLVLPNQLSVIAAETFSGDTSLVEVFIPDSVHSIGDMAFSGCTNLGWVSISGNTETLGRDVFTGCAEDLLIRTTPTSAACDYACNHQMDYQAGTEYRALLVGQTYSRDKWLHLYGPENDVVALSACLSDFGETPYQTTVMKDLSGEEILSGISNTFAAATENDVSLFYYSGHGVSASDSASQGSLLGISGKDYVSADQLRTALDQIPGRKIVIIDACYSGAMIGSKRGAAMGDVEAFTSSFIAAFSKKKRGNLATEGYFVLTSASADEECYEDEFDDVIMGVFTHCVATGLGHRADGLAIDANGNKVITVQEVYQYARTQLLTEGQHVQVYPNDCRWFGMLRRSRNA